MKMLLIATLALAAAGCATTGTESRKSVPLSTPVVEVDVITGSRLARAKGENYRGTRVIQMDATQRSDMLNQRGAYAGPPGR